jgi:acyl-CoA thioesterase-2
VAQRVEIVQGHRSILDAMVWSVGEVDGLEHDETIAPAVAGPEQLASVEDLLPDDAQPPFPFWNNLDEKPLVFETEWPPDGPRAAEWKAWLRFRPTATFDDPWVDAARCVILVDLPSWGSAAAHNYWSLALRRRRPLGHALPRVTGRLRCRLVVAAALDLFPVCHR